MNKVLRSILLILLVLVCINSLAFAKQNRNGDRDQDCLLGSFCDQPPSTVEGVVADIHAKGFGFDLEISDDTTVTFWGLGPAWYWEAAELARPEIGDTITVQYYQVVCEEEKNIAVAIINSEDDTLELRDCETGLPIWIQLQKQFKGNTGDVE